jgi:hypothetical protein
MDKFGEADKAFQEAQLLRKKTLLSYMEAGKALSQIRQGLEPATKTKPVETDLGWFTSFNHYLDGRIDRRKAYRCIYLFEHWDIAEKIGLLKEESCFRVIISDKILRWAVDKLEANPNWEGTAEDYFKEQEAVSKDKKESSKSELIHLRARLAELEAEVLLVPKYMERINQLETKCQNLEARLEEYRAIALTYITE